ncbi:hypothetical protein J31TS4_08110 [Paenibacillus sp. J31TS4]|uniref:GGDEF domain-containing protein n=1 Tax=Paenibacillus sp. J31TS4 TaxID=2807195 RepID=UPI001B06B2E0|nr:GGDEF domain-containing protein [Paenibacillus sp. J31TS4]GIP37531.1 hypothetical protein J31TS4_08110 [Paenibacillus sp. J31TS4]
MRWKTGLIGVIAGLLVFGTSWGLLQAGKPYSWLAWIPEAAGGAAAALGLVRLYRQSMIDECTGLFNRRFLFRKLDSVFRRHRAIGRPLAVAVIDIDDFRSFNSRYGHIAGDEVLREVGSRLCRHVGSRAYAARWGGEEFALVFPGADKKEALETAEAIRRSIQQIRLPFGGAEEVSVTISMGIVVDHGGYASAEELVNHADQVMYAAKQKKDAIEVGWKARSVG